MCVHLISVPSSYTGETSGAIERKLTSLPFKKLKVNLVNCITNKDVSKIKALIEGGKYLHWMQYTVIIDLAQEMHNSPYRDDWSYKFCQWDLNHCIYSGKR